MEESKGKKENVNKIKKVLIVLISIVCIISVILGVAITRNSKKTETSSNLEDTTNVVEGTTLFEDIGHYGIAVAGNNNADRGTAVNVGVKLINSYPENWEEIKKNIPLDILSRVNNMSGSRLDFEGTIECSWITTMIHDSSSDVRKKDILILKPDGSYELLSNKGCQLVPIKVVTSGWYYVSILDAPVSNPQTAWSIMTVYENRDLDLKYVNLKKVEKNGNIWLYGNSSNNYINVYYSNKYNLKTNYELFGIIIGGGVDGWSKAGYTEDKLEVILSDGTYKQLYEDIYNGKTIFEGRSNIDFANGTFNTIRSHNIKGGEIDIFYERIGKDYFNNKDVVGYKITKIGNNGINPQVLGISQGISYPIITMEIENIKNNIIENENIHIKTKITNSATDEESIGYDIKLVCKLDEALSEVENIVVKINGNIENVESVYNAETNEIQISGIDEILPNQVVTIEYDTKINSNIQNKGEVNNNVELPIEINVQSYPIDINALEEAEQEKYRELYVEEESTVNVSGIYKRASEGVEVKYIDEVTGEEIKLAENKTGYYGEEYQTEEKEIVGYELVEVPTNKVGTMREEKITVTYKYRKISKVIVKYVDVNNGEEIERIENTYKEGESYTTNEKEIEGYRLISVPENKAGIVEREDIIIEYGYKKIVIGVEVKYIDEVTGEEIETSEEIRGIEGDKYETSSKEIEGYELVEEPINANGEMREDLVTVTYKYRKVSKVIVRYINKNSGEEIEKIEKEYKEGESYTTESKNISGYRLIEIPVNANGVVGREDIEVIYEYRKIGGGIEIKYIDEVTGEEIETTEYEVGLVEEKYQIAEKEISGYELVEIPTNVTGTITEEKIIVTYKYRKVSKVIVMYIDKESGEEISREEGEYKEGESYKIESKEISGYKLIEKPKNTEGIVERKDIEVKYYYEREKVFVKVEINIVDENGNIIEVIEKEGYVGDKEEIELPEVDGYYTDDKNIVIEYGKENNINVMYKKKLFDLPNTSDINIYVYIGIFVISIVVISIIIKNIIKRKK